MELMCPKCSKALRIPDDKIPEAQRFALVCPSCNSRMTVEKPVAPSMEFRVSLSEQEPSTPSSNAFDERAAVGPDSTAAGQRPNVLPVDGKAALVYVDDAPLREAVRSWCDSKGAAFFECNDGESAAFELRINAYDVVVLYEDDSSEPILWALNEMPGDERRLVCVALIGCKSAGGEGEALRRSVDGCVQASDVGSLGMQIDAVLAAHSAKYAALERARGHLEKQVVL